MNIALLETLRARAGAFVPIADIQADPIRTSHDLDELERFGFALERHPYRGVAYRGPADRLCPDQIEYELNPRRIGRRISVWSRVGSTNDVAAAAAGSTANDGLVVLAEEQTSGRGSRGRSWVAPAGSSLLMSVLLFPKGAIAEPSWLTALAAVATADVLAELAEIDARIKFPNDVRVDGRKIAGILVERGAGVVVGLGLNANVAPDAFPEALRATATSLQVLTGKRVDRSELARALIRRMDQIYDEGLRDGPDPLGRAWRERLEGPEPDQGPPAPGSPPGDVLDSA